MQDRTAVLDSLIITYPFYIDRDSRQAVRRCLGLLISGPNAGTHLTLFSSFLHNETSKIGLAAASVFVLVEWCSLTVEVLSRYAELWKEWGVKIIPTLARALERCVALNQAKNSSRKNRYHSAIARVRRALRAVFTQDTDQKDIVDDIITQLTAKSSSPTYTNVILLDVVASECTDFEVIRARAGDYYAFYIREVLGSRTTLPSHIAHGLSHFFGRYMGTEDFIKELAPALERALLRAPEVVLDDLLAPLVASLDRDWRMIDLADALKKHLLKPLLNNVKSTNAVIRDGARKTFEQLAQRCHDETVIREIVEEMLKALKEAKNAEHRASIATWLGLMPVTDATNVNIATTVSTLALKEANESALAAECMALGVLVQYAVNHQAAVDSSLTKAFTTGLSDKKPSVRRIWALQWGTSAWKVMEIFGKDFRNSTFFETSLMQLAITWGEVVTNPIAALQAGLVTVAYIFLAVALHNGDSDNEKVKSVVKNATFESALYSSLEKSSFLTNHRIYGKLTNEEDFKWNMRALFATAPLLTLATTPSSASSAWAQAVLYLLNSDTVPPKTRQRALVMLKHNYLKNPNEIATTVISGLWQWLQNLEMEDRDTPARVAKNGRSRLHDVVQAISITIEERERSSQKARFTVEILDNQLISLLVLCRQPLIPRGRWIDMCLRGGVDPGDLVRRNLHKCLNAVKQPATVSTLLFGQDEKLHVSQSTSHRVTIMRSWNNSIRQRAMQQRSSASWLQRNSYHDLLK